MATTGEHRAHRRRCRRRWTLGALTSWNTLVHAPLGLAPARRARAAGRAEAQPAAPARRWFERAGVLHVHTTYSDGLSPFEEVAEVARACGLDFMLASDHATLAPLRDGKQGYYGDCLVLIGVELTCEEGYVLGLNLPPEFERTTTEAGRTLAEIEAAGGLGFVALPCDPRFAWRTFPSTGFVGIEIANLGTLSLRRLNPVNALRALLRYRRSRSIAGLAAASAPAPELRAWDRMTLDRPVVGIGSVDAHALLKLFGRPVSVPTYRDSFHVLRTHVLCSEAATGDARADGAHLYDSLAAGRCFLSFHIHGDATGFRFSAAGPTREAVMGETVALEEGMRLRAQFAGPKAVIRLLRSGRIVATARGRALEYAVREPGVYRVEAYRYGVHLGPLCLSLLPWIFSNPIYIRPAGQEDGGADRGLVEERGVHSLAGE